MKFLLFFLATLSFQTICYAAEEVGFFTHPDHPGKCYYNKNLILSAGEEAKLPGRCGVISCGDNSFATIQTCGVMLPPPGCRYTTYININAPYSDCCEKKLVCSNTKY